MADEGIKITKKKGLPPLSPRGDGDKETNPQPVKKKVKKKVQRPVESDSKGEENAEEVKPTPRRRRKRSPSQTKDSEPDAPPDSAKRATSPASATPKKKKKKTRPAQDESKDQTLDGEETAPKQENQGSKTSLLTKEGDTPRKKAGKKKKKVKKAMTEEDDFGESPWAEDLRTLEEDIVTAGAKEREEEGEEGEEETVDKESGYKKKDMKTTSILVPSRPLDKIFVETSTKFKGLDRGILTKQLEEEHVKAATTTATPVVTRQTTIDFAVASHRLFRVMTLFLHGLTGGLCLWLMVTIFKLTSFSKADFLEHYYETSMPLQCSLYFLLILCTVSACDRFDIGNPTPRFILRSLTLQNGTVSILFYLIALILNLVILRYEDKIYLYKEVDADPTLATTPNPADNVASSDVDAFRSLNTARCVFAILGWLVLSITPRADRLTKNLLSGETGLEAEMKTDKMMSLA